MNTLSVTGVITVLCAVVVWTSAADEGADRANAERLSRDGNWNDAYELYARLAHDPATAPRQIPGDLLNAVNCLQRLNRVVEADGFIDKSLAAQPGNWRLLVAAASLYDQLPKHGFIIGGAFERGQHRGGGQWANVQELDRMRALQLYFRALPLVPGDATVPEAYDFYFGFARRLESRGTMSWRMQILSDIEVLPDPDTGNYYGGGARAGAPADADGNPVYHAVPKDFESAASDGERWRWLLNKAAEVRPDTASHVTHHFAQFLWDQFGVQTMAQYSWFRPSADEEEGARTFDLHTLAENETIARLASGVKRFTLPDEYDFVGMLKRVADDPRGPRRDAVALLAQIFENRRQYDKAVTWWERYAEFDRDHSRTRIGQITGKWGTFEPIGMQPAGRGAVVDFRFRNGNRVSFEAFRVDLEKLVADVKAYLDRDRDQVEWERIDLNDIGRRLVWENQTRYIGGRVAQWSLDLEPRPAHFDRRVTVTTPLKDAGAYLVTAQMADGNTSRIILMLADTAIVRKDLDGKLLYFVADAVTGTPLAKANVEFFGWRQEWVQGTNKHRMITRNFAELTDADGQIFLERDQVVEKDGQGFQWVAVARTPEGRFAYHGFEWLGIPAYYDMEYNETKAYVITDRPVYRPEHTVKYKVWLRHAKYDMEDASVLAGHSVILRLHNPKGEEVFAKQLTLDAYGGLAGEYPLEDEAPLGVWSLSIQDTQTGQGGGGTFRVEEYKKPEYEVTVAAPTEPVMLGETVKAKIKATYYFGAPVTKADVKVKVLRYAHDARWYPYSPWDWFYGAGYWWFAYDYPWYPGWRDWGCLRPVWWWYPTPHAPPEVVLEDEQPIGPDGTVELSIDTSLAKEFHGDLDHRYEITAEVRDESRRTIVGTGQVLVARKPFAVFAWTDRGYYRVGDVIRASFAARTVAGVPVTGKGVLRLLALSYAADGTPIETEAARWDLDPGEDGLAQQQLKADRAGQYRLSYAVTDAAGHRIEGGYVLVIRGEGFDGKDFRFNHIELIPDKKEYRDGDTMELMVNVDRPGGTVVLFLRPANGVCLPPKVLRLEGKSTVVDVPITKKDMPNFFVEAFTVADGEVYSDLREIAVPPEKRVLNVEVEPSAHRYKPGEKGSVTIRLTDMQGEPFSGTAVVSVYDKSVEYISGGLNVGDIREFFWKWRRTHHRMESHSLLRTFYNLLKPKEEGMGFLGVFGALVADDDVLGDDRMAMNGMGTTMGGVGLRKSAMKMRGAPGGMGGMEGMAFGAAAPMASMVVADAMAGPAMEAGGMGMGGGAGGEAGAAAPVTVRTQFADTALWISVLDVGADGTVQTELPMPENLTTWKIRVWALGHGTKVGEGTAEVITSKNLILRMQAPRFFVQKDEVVLSANIHNYLEGEKAVTAVLETDGPCLEVAGEATRAVRVAAGGEERVDWTVKVVRDGEAVIRMKALTDEESDAMEMRFPVYVHGIDKMESFCGVIRPDKTRGEVSFTVPEERRPETGRLELRYSPTLAMAMLDALPYLLDYPYGCTEQTLNRFLPAVLTQKVVQRMGVSLADIREKRTNLNAQEIGDDVERAKQWQRYDRDPVFDEAEMGRIVRRGLQDLGAMQLTDGGWGWFSGYGEQSWPHTTALVVHGLQTAVENDVAVVPDVLARGVEWLKGYQDRQIAMLENALKDPKVDPWKGKADSLDALVYMVLADADVHETRMRDFLYRDRNDLPVYAKATFGLGLHRLQQTEMRDMIIRNIEQYLVRDDENATAYLNLGNQGYWWYWWGDEIEAHAFFLKLLVAAKPEDETASRLVKYLLNNRKHATYWRSTRDTAFCVEAFADYIEATGEDKPDMNVTISLDGEAPKIVRITAENLFSYDNAFVVGGDALTGGAHELRIMKNGTGPLYYNAYVSYFTLEDFITKAGLEVKVDRKVYRLKRVEATAQVAGARNQVVEQRVEKYEREELKTGDTLKSGDLVEVELLLDSKNDYEYIIVEDRKAAGFEPVDLRSGYTGNSMGAYVEFRDERVSFFVRSLARGTHSVSYRVRAEIPGRFSALPATVKAMYAPELRGNSDEIKLGIED